MRATQFHLRTVLVLIALAAILSAVVAPMTRQRPPVHPSGTWLGDGSILTLWMPDGSVVVATPETRDGVLAEYAAQSERHYGVAKLPPGLPYWKPNFALQRTRPAAARAGHATVSLSGPVR
jgi:hypothetical protein